MAIKKGGLLAILAGAGLAAFGIAKCLKKDTDETITDAETYYAEEDEESSDDAE